MVQPTEIARRKYKHRGKMAASYRRKVKVSALKTQLMCDNDDNDKVYYSLPKQKGRSNKLAHSFSAAVSSNRANATKH